MHYWVLLWARQVFRGRVAFLPLSRRYQLRRCRSATTLHRALPVCELTVLGMPWGTARSSAVSAVCSRCGGACTGCYCGPGRCFGRVAVLPLSGVLQMRRRRSATTALHNAVPVCDGPALAMPGGTARSNTVFAVSIKCGGSYTHWVLRPGWAGGLVGLWFCRFCGVFQSRRRRSATTVH